MPVAQHVLSARQAEDAFGDDVVLNFEGAPANEVVGQVQIAPRGLGAVGVGVGCVSTARTSPQCRSNASCYETVASAALRSTPCRTSMLETPSWSRYFPIPITR